MWFTNSFRTLEDTVAGVFGHRALESKGEVTQCISVEISRHSYMLKNQSGQKKLYRDKNISITSDSKTAT